LKPQSLENFLLGKRPDGKFRAPAIRFSESMVDVHSPSMASGISSSSSSSPSLFTTSASLPQHHQSQSHPFAARRAPLPAATTTDLPQTKGSKLRGMVNRAKDKAKDQVAQRVLAKIATRGHESEDEDSDETDERKLAPPPPRRRPPRMEQVDD
jgi:hypothetical protein